MRTSHLYARDRYQCRYCGEKVILTQVMRLLSRLHPNGGDSLGETSHSRWRRLCGLVRLADARETLR
jgi:hypothetical protein